MRAQWYYDSFAGLIPVKVLTLTGISGRASTAQRCKLEVTKTTRTYRKGEIIDCFGLHLVPWQAVRPNGRILPYDLTITTQEGK